jgi:hypothetical protein
MRPAMIVAFAMLLTAPCASPAFAAQKPKKRGEASGVTRLAISPKKPIATDELEISFRAGKLRSEERYLVGIGDRLETNDQCTAGYQVVVHGRKRPRQLVELTFYPNQVIARDEAHFYGGQAPSTRRFCAGVKTLQIGRIDPDGNVRLITRRKVRIAEDPAFPERVGTGVKISLLEGSSFVIQAPGRPDRTLTVGGSMRGVIPSEFRPNTDIEVSAMTGALFLSSISPDPLCAGPTYRVELGLAQRGPSKMLLRASGDAELSLELLADPLSLAGCAAPAAPGKSTLTLSGKVTADGLVRLPISGTIPGVQIAPDLQATVTLNLVVGVDLSGRG